MGEKSTQAANFDDQVAEIFSRKEADFETQISPWQQIRARRAAIARLKRIHTQTD